MCAVVQLNHRDYAETLRITKHKINMLAGNAIESRLPATPTRASHRLNNICQPDLGKNLVI